MRFMMMIKATPASEAGAPPNPAVMAGMGRLAAEMVEAGVMVAMGGLQPSAAGTRISIAGGRRSVTDGPFSETKELIGGFAILLAESKQEAIALAQRCVDVHVDAGVADLEIEIRPLSVPPGSDSGR